MIELNNFGKTISSFVTKLLLYDCCYEHSSVHFFIIKIDYKNVAVQIHLKTKKILNARLNHQCNTILVFSWF